MGNFPQAFSHLGLVRAADALQAAIQNREPSEHDLHGTVDPEETR